VFDTLTILQVPSGWHLHPNSCMSCGAQHGDLTPRWQRGVTAGSYPVEDGEGVPGIGVGKGKDTKQLAQPGLLDFQKPGREERETQSLRNYSA
jgi:hypothetical protein